MEIDLWQMVIGAAIAGGIALAAWRVHALSGSGALATLLLGTIVFGLGGVRWSVPLVTFFVLSSVLSKIGSHDRKRTLEEVFEKGSRRDAGQVIANGGVAGLIVLIDGVAQRPELYAAYVGALAAAAADTWGTEIGVMSRGRVLSLRTLRFAEPGISGGISMLGTLGAALGALSVAASGAFWSDSPSSAIAIGVIAGVGGMFVDSLLGAWAQAGYRCRVCGLATERTIHCGEPAILVRGTAWITNDIVNIACCLAGALIGYLLAV